MKECERNKVYVFLLTAIVSIVKGQHVIKNVTFSDTLFSSPGYVDGLNYGINATRDYRFSTYPNYTMVFTVVEFVLESADKQSDCLYDKVTLYDGYDNSAPVLNVLCGTITPGTTYTTTGDTVYVVFYSDYSNTYKGFQMSVKADGPTFTTATLTSSPRTLTTSTTATTGQHTVKNVTFSDTLFSSPGYVDGLNYGINTTREYRFSTYPGRTMILTVVEFELESEDRNHNCLYDKVTLYDGYDNSAPILNVLCGTITPGTTYTTTGDTVYVVFYSDYSNTFKGFQMSVKADGPTFTTATLTSSPRTLTTSTTATTGQHTVKNVTFSDTLFSSPGYVDGLNYGINATRDYRFSTYPNYTMVFTVVEFVLESADKQSDCLYDKVTLYDGYDNTAPVLNVLCGTITAGTTYQTTGDTVYVVFYSDYSNTYKGFQMSVKADGPTFTTAALTSSPRTLTTSTTDSSTTATTALPDNGLLCFGCEYTTALSYCDSIQSCKVNQMCYLQRARNPQGHNHYRSGCMDQQICYRHNQSDNGLSSETCLQCCTEHFCNSHGCGDHGFPPKESRGPICLDCAYASHPNECDRVTICSQEQSCHIEELQWGDVSIFHLGCKSIHECAFETRSVTDMNDASTAGKDVLSQRSVPLCKACCQDDFCNRNCTRSGSNNQLEIVG